MSLFPRYDCQYVVEKVCNVPQSIVRHSKSLHLCSSTDILEAVAHYNYKVVCTLILYPITPNHKAASSLPTGRQSALIARYLSLNSSVFVAVARYCLAC